MAEHLTSCHKGKQRPGSTFCGSRRQGNKTLLRGPLGTWANVLLCHLVVVSCQLTEQHNELEDEVAKGLSGNVDTMELFCFHCVSWKGNNGLFTANCLGGKRCHTWYCWSEDNKWVWEIPGRNKHSHLKIPELGLAWGIFLLCSLYWVSFTF